MDTQGEVSGMHFMASKEQRFQPNIPKLAEVVVLLRECCNCSGPTAREYLWEENTALQRHMALGTALGALGPR